MTHLRSKHLLFFILILGLVMSACGSEKEETKPSTSKTALKFQLSWIHDYSAAPLYMAINGGHFAGQNLEVSILEGGFGETGYIEPIQTVLDGTADLATASSTAILQARAEGKPVVAIATVLQRSPFGLISLSASNIQRPEDLKGKRIMVSDGGARFTTEAFLAAQGIGLDEVTLLPRTEFGIGPLLNGDTDVLGGWVINEAVMVREAGREASYLLMSDYGYDDYDFVIFTTEDMVNNRRDVVERFLRGLVEGIQDVIANPRRAAEVVLTYNSELKLEEQEARIQVTLPLMNPAGSNPGMMNPDVWQQNLDSLLANGVITETVDLTKVYNLELLNTVYQS